MSTLVVAMWGIAFLVALIGGLPYAVWVILTAIRKKWKQVGIQVASPVAVLLILWAVSGVLNDRSYAHIISGIYDTDVKLGKPIYEYDSSRAFNGDGYSISVYALPIEIRTRFESADARLFSDFPKRPGYRERWSTEHWREAPFDPAFQKYLEFALSSYDSGREHGLYAQFQAIREALSRKGTFYAFFFFSHGDYPGDIDLFIVDLEGDRLYSINHNT